MENSILNSIKKTLGVSEDDTAFDTDIIICINSALATLTQLGVGPEEGFSIEDADDEWDDLTDGDPKLNPVKTYIFMKTKLMFDPPQNGFLVTAMEKVLTEAEWRLNVTADTGEVSA